ncbi:MAG TPA: hypothetical protein VMH85_15030 [Terriglobales bacterium]|nr:hypothetical protein [Terriglobales bacterium]
MRQRVLSLFAVMAVFLALSPATSARGRHPEIRAALDALRDARAHLQAAAHDYHGHRADAIRATDEAIHQLEICMQYD